jgi:hypothetical protein
MSTTFSEADDDVLNLMSDLITDFFPDIVRCDPPVRIAVLMAENADGPALRKWGGNAAAMIKKSAKEEKPDPDAPDVRILIDAKTWEGLSDVGRKALLAHECQHIDIPWGSDGKTPKTDDYGRVKVRLRPDDWILTGFRRVAEWFGEDALEVRSIRAVQERLRQAMLPFGRDDQSAAAARAAELDREPGEGEGDGGLSPEISSVTLSVMGGKPVTLGPKEFDAIGKAGKALRQRAAMSPAD